MKHLLLLAASAIALTAGSHPAQAQERPRVGIVEKLGTTLPLEIEVYDEDGVLVPLSRVITKPTILTFVYYRCPGICSPLLTEVTDVVNKMGLVIGKDYQIVTLSFDPSERADLAAEKRTNYLAELTVAPLDPGGWRFFTAESAAIWRLTDAAGFYFERSGRDWIHAASLIVVSGDGKIIRYLYGLKHLPFDVKMALFEASEGRPGPAIAKVLTFCYAYDPEGKRYAFSVTRVGGVVILGFVGAFVAVFLLRRKRKAA